VALPPKIIRKKTGSCLALFHSPIYVIVIYLCDGTDYDFLKGIVHITSWKDIGGSSIHPYPASGHVDTHTHTRVKGVLSQNFDHQVKTIYFIVYIFRRDYKPTENMENNQKKQTKQTKQIRTSFAFNLIGNQRAVCHLLKKKKKVSYPFR
jgi:hypothetical protein